MMTKNLLSEDFMGVNGGENLRLRLAMCGAVGGIVLQAPFLSSQHLTFDCC
jgi:hypothetical protein